LIFIEYKTGWYVGFSPTMLLPTGYPLLLRHRALPPGFTGVSAAIRRRDATAVVLLMMGKIQDGVSDEVSLLVRNIANMHNWHQFPAMSPNEQ